MKLYSLLILNEIQKHKKNQALNTINPFRPEFTNVIFIHYKPRIAVAILDL